MPHLVLVARILLGGMFVLFGANGVFGFMEPPAEMPAPALDFLQALGRTGFMHPLRAVAELASGLMILTGIFLPLGLTILAPVLVHIVLYHHFLDPAGLIVSYVLVALELFLVYAHFSAFRGLLTPRVRSRWSSEIGAAKRA